MCGIYGYVRGRSQEASEDVLQGMGKKMIFRGPDGCGQYVDRNVAIGMRRLTIVDREGSSQPILCESERTVLVGNGEVYNYKYLRETLKKKGIRFSTNGDIEVIGAIYEMYGVSGLEMIDGMFAVAIYDRIEGGVVLARDRFGTKPLYYREIGDETYFASTMKALEVSGDLEPSRLAFDVCLGLSYVPAPMTIMKDVYKLLPGEVRVIKNGSSRRMGIIDSKVTKPSSGPLDTEELANVMQDFIPDEVDCCVALSGGLDSSLVAYFAGLGRKEKRLDAITVRFSGVQSEDGRTARRLCQDLGIYLNEVVIENSEYQEMIDNVVSFMSEPLCDSAAVPSYVVAKEAADLGYKVILSGAGADEMFCGYERYKDPNAISAERLAAMNGWVGKLLKKVVGVWREDTRGRLTTVKRNYLMSISGLDTGQFRELIDDKERWKEMNNYIDGLLPEYSLKDSKSKIEFDRMTYLSENLMMLGDQTTMSVSIEGRFPYLTRGLENRLDAVSRDQWFDKKEMKLLLRKVGKEVLPGYILERRKEGFNAPMDLMPTGVFTKMRERILERRAPLMDRLYTLNNLAYFDLESRKERELIYSIYILNSWCLANGY